MSQAPDEGRLPERFKRGARAGNCDAVRGSTATSTNTMNTNYYYTITSTTKNTISITSITASCVDLTSPSHQSLRAEGVVRRGFLARSRACLCPGSRDLANCLQNHVVCGHSEIQANRRARCQFAKEDEQGLAG